MSLLDTVIKPRLVAGKYPIRLIEFKSVANDNGGYVQLTLAMPDRVINQNFFPSNLDYLGKTLKDQIGKADQEMKLVEVLTEAKGKDLFCVVSYNEYGLNVAFHEQTSPVAKTKEEVDFK